MRKSISRRKRRSQWSRGGEHLRVILILHARRGRTIDRFTLGHWGERGGERRGGSRGRDIDAACVGGRRGVGELGLGSLGWARGRGGRGGHGDWVRRRLCDVHVEEIRSERSKR